MWKQRISDNNFRNALEALQISNKTSFGNVFKILLSITKLLPVSVATPELSFSCLKIIKTYLQNTISQKWLNGLASMNIHKDISIDQIFEEFFKTQEKYNIV